MRVFSWSVAALLVGSVACGGQVAPGGDGGASSGSSSGSGSASSSGASGSGGGSGSSSGETVPPCPSEPPTAGAKCVAPGQQACAYFSTNQSCQAFICDDSGVWQSSAAGC